MYNSPFNINNNVSSTNPFALPGPSQSAQSLDNSIMETYAKLNALKQRQQDLNNLTQNPQMQQAQRTVFSDIATEMSGLGEDELNFILSSKDYKTLNERHQREFSEFITEKFANEYIASGRTKTLEEMLVAILDNLKRKDGTRSGIKWSKDEVASVAGQYDVKSKIEAAGKKYDPLYFWFAMNYVYAVHNNMNRTLNGYVELAVDEITNKNICFHDVIKRIFKKI